MFDHARVDRRTRLFEHLLRLEEVSSRAYPSLERSPRENWVEKAGGLPSYIERIAKHLHYEKGMTISHAIATAVNTVKKWCSGSTVSSTGGVQTAKASPATRAKACAAVAQWEAKKKRSKVSEAAVRELEESVRAEGGWFWPTLAEAGRVIAGAEAMRSADYPSLAEARILRTAGRLGSALDWEEKLHPRAAKGRRGGGQFASKPGGPARTPPGRKTPAAGGRKQGFGTGLKKGDRYFLDGEEHEVISAPAKSMKVRARRLSDGAEVELDKGTVVEWPGKQGELPGRGVPPAERTAYDAPMLNPRRTETLQALIGWALDEDHASPAPGWLEDRAGVTARELDDARKSLANPSPQHISTLQALIGYALDEDHDSPGGDWLDGRTGMEGSADTLEAVARALTDLKGRKTPAVGPELSEDERGKVADALEAYAAGVQENIEDDRLRDEMDGEPGEGGAYPVVEDYLADADRIRAGEAPLHELTREVLLDETGPAAMEDDPDAYLELAKRLLRKER
jgi:hypothetical protein